MHVGTLTCVSCVPRPTLGRCRLAPLPSDTVWLVLVALWLRCVGLCLCVCVCR